MKTYELHTNAWFHHLKASIQCQSVYCVWTPKTPTSSAHGSCLPKQLQTSPFCFQGSDSTAAAKSLQSCPTLYDPIDGSPPGSPVPGILQARTLEWVAIAFSNAWKWKVTGKSLSSVRLLATPWTVAHQAPPSMGFSRQQCWSGVPLPSPGKSTCGS